MNHVSNGINIGRICSRPWVVTTRRRCGLLPNYFRHWLYSRRISNVRSSFLSQFVYWCILLPHDAMLARYCRRVSACLADHLSVRPSQAGTVRKRLNVGSCKQRPVFWCKKISAKFQLGRPIWGRQIEVGWVQMGDFRPTSRYISETVQDRDIRGTLIGTRMRSIEWHYFQWPWMTPNYPQTTPF